MQKRANRTNSTFGFCRHESQRRKTKRAIFLANARTEYETEKVTLQTELKDKKDRWQKR